MDRGERITTESRSEIRKDLARCEDITEDEIDKVVENVDSVDCEKVENFGDRYIQKSVYNEKGECICEFEVYVERDYVNLLFLEIDNTVNGARAESILKHISNPPPM